MQHNAKTAHPQRGKRDLLGLSLSNTPSSAGLETPKARRGLPPELSHAISLERLWWTLEIKGLKATTAKVVTRGHRLGIEFPEAKDGRKTLTLRGALKQIDALQHKPDLVPDDPDSRSKALTLERWLMADVADSVLWCLLRPPVPKNAAGFSDQFMTSLIMRALDVVASISQQKTYLFGDRLSSADLAAAAVLAPVARKEGWAWAGQMWAPLSSIAGRSVLVRHPGAAWVRGIYDRHAQKALAVPDQSRVWVP